MSSNSQQDNYNSAPVCGTGMQVMYAWSKDAPKLKLPKDVGFKIGGRSLIQYLVLQVHYATVDKFKDGSTDDSGVFMYYTQIAQPKLAGVFVLGTFGMIPPMLSERMETDCMITEDKIIHPFAFSVHTHSLGKVVSGYLVTADANGKNHWTLIGKKEPLLPQTFYPMSKKLIVKQGDVLAARCTMKSDRNIITYIGATNNDEMCNFYLMYYVEEGEPLRQKYCFSQGAPFYYWKNTLNNIPDKEASSLE